MMLQPKIIIIVDISKNEYYYHHHCNYYLVFSWPWHADSIYWVYVIPKEFYSFFTNFFIYMFTLFVWSSVRFYPINVKTAEPIGPKFCVGPQWAQERFMKDKNFKFLSPPKFDFH